LGKYLFLSGGGHVVTLTAVDNDGGVSTLAKSFSVLQNSNPIADFTCTSNKPYQVSCQSTTTDVDVSAGVDVFTEYDWGLQNKIIATTTSSTLDYNFQSGGDFVISLSVKDSYGGIGIVSKKITVKDNAPPLANFVCTNTSVRAIHCASTATDSDGVIASTAWVLDDGSNFSGLSFDHTFLNDQAHAVTLLVSDDLGASSSSVQNIQPIKNQAPLANFVCTNTGVRTVHCLSSSSDIDGTIATTTWSLDDGANPAGISFDHTFLDDQAHTVNLLVTDDLGASTSSIQTVLPIKNQAPQGDIVASTLSGAVPLIVSFTAQNVLDLDGSVSSIDWTFSDGTTGSGAALSHTFTTVGSITVSLKITDNLGAVTQKSITIEALEPLKFAPSAFFKYFEQGTLIEVHASLNSSQFDIDHAFYTIDGGETVALTEFYPDTKNLIDLKNYVNHQMSLTVVDVRGQTSTFTHQINLTDDPSILNPYVDFKAVQSSPRTTFLNMNSVFDPDKLFSITNYHLDFGDNTFQDITDDTFATHTYSSAGTYSVTLTATTGQNSSARIAKNVTVTNEDVAILNPVASFGYQVYSFAQNVSFYNEHSGTPNGSIISYLWEFGDGATGTGNKIAHFYSPGSYFVTLTVTDAAGLRSSQTQHITITADGNDIVANIACDDTTGFTANCKIIALDRLNQINSVRVTWGDSTANTLTNLSVPGEGIYKKSHTYATTKNYTATLTVGTTRGVSQSMALVIPISAIKAPVAKINCTVNNLNIYCDGNGTTDPSGLGIASYSFKFGDGPAIINTTAPQNYTQHTYSAVGIYTVTMTALSNSGLSNTTSTQMTTVNGAPIAIIGCYTNNMLVYCNGFSSYDPEQGALTYEFNYSDGFIETNSSGVSYHAYTQSGLHAVSLKVTDDFGNIGVASTQVQTVLPPNLLPIPVLNCFSNAPYTLKCNALNSFDNDGHIIIYKIDWDDQTSESHADGNELTHIFQTGGIHQIKLTAIDNDGGMFTITNSYDVHLDQPPIASITCSTPGPQRVSCYSNSYDPDIGDQIVEYKWSLGNGITLTSLTPSLDYTYPTSSTYTVSLNIKDSYGATASAAQEITTIENLPPIAIINCLNSGLQTISCNSFSYDPDGSIATTHWSLDDGFVFDGNAFTHTFVSGENHNATIITTDNLGISSALTQELHVLVNKLPTFDISADNISGNLPLVVNFKTLNAIDPDGTIVSYKWLLEGAIISELPEFSFTFTNAGIYNVKLQVTDNNNGMTEKSVTIRTSDPSNLIILTDKDNGIADLNVHFDASNSTDPDGQIEKLEWFYQGKKFAEGLQADYEFDLVGDQSIELIATNNFGIETKVSKTITVATPPIYLEGITSDVAFVDREYKAIFNLKLDPAIIPENVSFDLKDAPSGVSFDPVTMQLTWTPKAEDKGEVLFYLNVSDGVLNYRRIFKISVHELVQLASISTSIEGGNYTIQAPNSPLNNTNITLPPNEVPYSINIFQSMTGDHAILSVETSVFLKEPLVLNFENEVSANQRVDQFNHIFGFESVSVGVSYINRVVKKLIACPLDLVAIEFHRDTFQDKYKWDTIENSIGRDDYGASLGSNKVKILKTLSAPLKAKVTNILEHIKSVSSKMSETEIYLIDNSIPGIDDSPGAHLDGDKQTIYLNLAALNGISTNQSETLVATEEYKKHTALHEYYHVLQARALGCTPNYYGANHFAYKNLTEGSADYAALFQLTDDERKSVVKTIYKSYLTKPYAISSSVLAKGMFNEGVGVKSFEYQTRIMWDTFNFPLIFFKNFGDELRNPVAESGNEKVLRILKKSAGGDISTSLLDLTDGIYNYKSNFNGPLTSLLKDATIFTGWDSDEAKSINKISFISASKIKTDSNEILEINLGDLPSLSGISKNFMIDDLISKFSYVYSQDTLSLEIITNDPEVKMNARALVVNADGTVSSTASNVMRFTPTTSSHISTAPVIRPQNLTNKIIFNVVNGGSNSIKNLKLRITFLQPILNREYTICNGGLSADVMNFTLGKNSFSLAHIYTVEPDWTVSKLTCECKKIKADVGTSVAISINATETQTSEHQNLTPFNSYTGVFNFTENYQNPRYFTNDNDYIPPAPQHFKVVDGIVYGVSCTETVYK
jgi:PKD repeat protein